MDTVEPHAAETEDGRRARETAMVAQGLAAIAAGRTVSLEEVQAWADSLGTDHELPLPRSGR